ncbi:hypothetical protein [Burkholderia ubonensis]|uniref:hypothetical protein n=1 Tax=Burkholderia ubonensis TaxID=101571 RepID=UPI0018DF9E1A|nr:hypothetical protein [Burkholderia ubonensis]
MQSTLAVSEAIRFRCSNVVFGIVLVLGWSRADSRISAMGSKPLVLGLLARGSKAKGLDFIEWALLVASAQAE